MREKYKLITYLIGSMEKTAEKDDGSSKREIFEKEFLLRDIYPINPVKLESSKIDMSTDELKEKMKGWVAGGSWDLFRKYAKSIWKGVDKEVDGYLIHIPGDVDYVLMSNFITFVYNKGDMPCIAKGTNIRLVNGEDKKIEDIKSGDVIWGFKKLKNKTILVKNKVIDKYYKGYKKCILIKDNKNNKIVSTLKHEFLTRNKKHGSIYSPISEINNVFSVKQRNITTTFLKGWITGYLQHDGNFSETWRKHQITCLSDKEHEMKKVKLILAKLGFHSTMNKIKREKKYYYQVNINRLVEYYILKNWRDNHYPFEDFKRGWITGSIDADGYYERETIRYTQSLIHKHNIEIFELYLKDLDIKYSKNIRRKRIIKIKNRIINSSKEITICISKNNAFSIASQLQYKIDKLNLSLQTLNSEIKLKKTYKRFLYDLQTETGNFIANGFIIHNCGSFGEAFIAMEHNIPVYLIADINKTDLPKSLLQCIEASEGEVFNTVGKYFEFLDEKYKLKRKELKEEKK